MKQVSKKDVYNLDDFNAKIVKQVETGITGCFILDERNDAGD